MANPFDEGYTKDYGSVTGRGSGFQPSSGTKLLCIFPLIEL